MSHPFDPAYWEQQYQNSRNQNIRDFASLSASQRPGFQPNQGPRQPVPFAQAPPSGSPGTASLTADPGLIGRAKYWGIPEQVATQMPMEHLQQLIAEQEANAHGAVDDAHGIMQAITHLAAVPAMFGVGALEAIANLPRNLPIVGETFREMSGVQAANEWAGQLEEGVRSSTRSDFQWVNSTLKEGGSMAAMWYPGAAAWKMAAVAGKAVGVLGISTPIIRMAAQGGAAGWLLEGGGSHSGQAIALGSILGAAAHPAEMALTHYGPSIAAAMDRVSRSFGGGWMRNVGQMVDPAQAVAETVAQGQSAPQVAQAAMESNVDRLVRMANDPAATAETRQQAKDFLSVLNRDVTTGEVRQVAAENAQHSASTPQPAWSTPLSGPIGPGGLPEQYVSPMNQPPHDQPYLDYINGGDQGPPGGGSGGKILPFGPVSGDVEGIASASLVAPDGSRFDAPSHWQALEQATAAGHDPSTLQDMFLTTHGRVVDRVEAGRVDDIYSGNQISGEPLHTNNLTGMDVPEASQAASSATKQAIIIDSPTLAEASGATEINDVTVARAAQASNPGGVNVVPGVNNPEQYLQGITGIGGDVHFRFAQRPGEKGLVALTSDQPISDEAVAQFEQHGMFAGQAAKTASGKEVVVTGFNGDLVSVKPRYGGPPYRTKKSNILPSSLSAQQQEVPGMYEAFHEYVNGRVQATSEAMGGAILPDRLETLRTKNLPHYMEDFLDQAGITNLGERARISEHFNDRIVSDYAASVPEESAFQDRMEQATSAVENGVDRTPTAMLDEAAQTKGFMVVPQGATGSYKLIDMTAVPVGESRAPMEISFSTRQAAEEWIGKVERPAPDVTPPVDVPIEVARALPRQSHMEPKLDNARLDEATANAAEDIATTIGRTDPALADHVRGVIAEAKASGQLSRIEQAWNYGLAQFQPMRARMSTIDQRLTEAGLGDIRPHDDWDNLTTQLTKKHNWENPWMDRWARVMDHFDAKQLREGEVTRIYEIEDNGLRLQRAQEAGFSPRQVQAIDEMHQFFRDIFPQTEIDPAREIARYISHVKARQTMGDSVPSSYEGYTMSGPVEPFYDMVRAGGMQMREMDARQLGNVYVRALGFNKFMKDTWVPAMDKWNALKQIPELEPLANTFINWANLMKTGYVPGNDMILDAAHSVVNFLMPGISRQQVAKIFNQGLSNTHLALLGYRPDVMARDSIQLFLALPRAGTDLLAVMRDIATGDRGAVQTMTDRGLEAGTIVLGKPRIADRGVFEENMAMTPEGAVPQEGPRGPLYRVLQATTDALHDMVPDGFRHLEGSKLHPLYFYTKQSEMMRMVVGEAGIRRAERAITDYRAAGADGSMDQLMGDSMARTFDPPIQRKFQELIASGQDKEAAHFMARQLTDATMFRYGMVENPEIARSTFGRIGMQFGNFSTQFYQYAKESLKNGTYVDKAKFLAMMGGVTMGLNAAQKVTGWDFSKWQFYNALTFTGGPWAQQLFEGQNVAASINRMAQSGDRPGTGATEQDAAVQTGRFAQGLVGMMNPLQGAFRDAAGVRSAMDSPNRPDAFGRLFVTGERSNSIDYQRIEEQIWGQPRQAEAAPPAPYASPVSAGRVGTPAPPPLQSYQDSLGYLVGGQPAVANKQMPDGVYGTYQPAQPSRGINADTVFMNPGHQSEPIPRDFTLAHEMGHRLYYDNEPLKSPAQPQGPPSDALRQIIAAMHARERYGNTTVSEPFAQAFGQAMQNVRGQPYTPPAATGPANPADVGAMERWMRERLAQRGAAPPSPPGSGAQY